MRIQSSYNQSFTSPYSFQAQEHDDEIAGKGNHTSAEFWEYDTRLGRRWNIDPVIKANYSSYLTFGNNPVIFIDPNGRTDYYNTKGKKIGSDGLENSEKRMALNRSTQKEIKRATKQGINISLNSNVYKDIIQIPNPSTLDKMEKMWSDTKNGKEQTMMVGKNASGQETQIVKEGSEGSAPSGVAFEEMREMGISPLYSVHTHPYNVTKKPDGTISTSTPDPSFGDINAAQAFKSFEPGFNSDGNQQIVIGPKYAWKVNEESGETKLTADVRISFFNGNNTTPFEPDKAITNGSTMKANGTMDFGSFLKAARKANTN